MSIFRKKIKTVGFLSETTLRIARRDENLPEALVDEKSYSLENLSKSGIFSEIRKDFGQKMHLVIAEEGVYTFSVSLPKEKTISRAEVSAEVDTLFLEKKEETSWDYKVIDRTDEQVLLEITEVKKKWNDILIQAKAAGIQFESIIPESVALAQIRESDIVTGVLHRKGEEVFLLVCCEKGIVWASFLLRKPLKEIDFSGFAEYCKEKKGKEMSLVFGSGFSTEDLKEINGQKESQEKPLDPLLGVRERRIFQKDENTLDLADSIEEKPWKTRVIGKLFDMKKQKQGFTLLEILLVVGIIAILATIIVMVLDPSARFRDARESRRLSDIQAINNAVHQYIIAKKGSFPTGIDSRERQIGKATTGCELKNSICNVQESTDCVDLSGALENYISGIPEDPEFGSTELTRYTIKKEGSSNRIIVKACDSIEGHVVQ